MFTRRKKIVVAVFLAAISVISAFAILDYLYNKQTDFNGVYKFAPDQYYFGKSLPSSYSVPAYEYAYNMTGNFTAQYRLVPFPYTVWENGTFGSFEFGVTFGTQSGPMRVIGIPFYAHISPYVWIGLLSAKYNFSGYLGYKPISLIAYSNLSYVSPINFTYLIEPSVWNLYTVNQTANISTREVVVNTLGTVNYLYPYIPANETKVLFTLYSGVYYLVLKLELYSITPFQTHSLTEFTITEPWVIVD